MYKRPQGITKDAMKHHIYLIGNILEDIFDNIGSVVKYFDKNTITHPTTMLWDYTLSLESGTYTTEHPLSHKLYGTKTKELVKWNTFYY